MERAGCQESFKSFSLCWEQAAEWRKRHLENNPGKKEKCVSTYTKRNLFSLF
jgi:hypothetical protein